MRVVFCVAKEKSNQNTLDAVRKMILQSGLDYIPAKVNAHWPRLSYGPSIGRGQIAQREYIDIYLKTLVPVQTVQACLEHGRPQGITLLEVKRVPYSLASVPQLAAAAVYVVEGDFSANSTKNSLEDPAVCTRWEVVQQAHNGMRFTIDVSSFVRKARLLAPDRLELTLVPVSQKWPNPLLCIYAWLGIQIDGVLEDLTDERFKIIREGLYWQDSVGDLHLI